MNKKHNSRVLGYTHTQNKKKGEQTCGSRVESNRTGGKFTSHRYISVTVSIRVPLDILF